MRFLGLDIKWPRSSGAIERAKSPVSVWSVPTGFRRIVEPFTGAFQRGQSSLGRDGLLSFPPAFSCATLIAGDIAKMSIEVIERDQNGIAKSAKGADADRARAFLKKPNRYQNRIRFVETWVLQKLIHGNFYGAKLRGPRNLPLQIYPLDAGRTRAVVSPGASVGYRLSNDNLQVSNTGDIVAPASEIVHDLMNPLFHPLVGLPPLYAFALSAQAGSAIQQQAANYAQNQARPSLVFTHPQAVDEEELKRFKKDWDESYSGGNQGRIAVLAGGLQVKELSGTMRDAEFAAQLKISREDVCSAYHVPPFKIGIGDAPKYDNAVALTQIYYADCLQRLIEDLELTLTEALELPDCMSFQLRLEDLMRMDARTLIEWLKEAVAAGIMAPNEARARLNLPPVPGGDTPYMQQQNYSLADLDARGGAGAVPASDGKSWAAANDTLVALTAMADALGVDEKLAA